jgi:hypothetical protein
VVIDPTQGADPGEARKARALFEEALLPAFAA